jgi:formate hydrogenlyase subunit 6/NADH:ubiquinone oxidoreductase subunit I
MIKHLVSELKEVLVCLQAGQVTLGYPFQPHSPELGFRGKVVMETERCVGCGACANACPPRLITLRDTEKYRVMDLELRRCTYCAQCRDVCPQKAITLSTQFETASTSMSDMQIQLSLKLVRCKKCGEVVGTQRQIDQVKAQLTAQMGLALNTMIWLDWCLACKRQEALTTAARLEVA